MEIPEEERKEQKNYLKQYNDCEFPSSNRRHQATDSGKLEKNQAG